MSNAALMVAIPPWICAWFVSVLFSNVLAFAGGDGTRYDVHGWVLGPVATAQPTPDQLPTVEQFKSMRYGVFNHIVYRISITPDGKRSYTDVSDFADKFDVNVYADTLKSFGVEYVIFSVWHKSIYALCPLKSLEKWLPGHTAKRDLVGEIADALNNRGIKLILYAHPSDAHDLTPNEQVLVGYSPTARGVQPKYNDFINDVYSELATQYGDRPNVLGFWWDSWRGNNGCLDASRLRKTVLTAFPRAIILSNNASDKIVDFYSAECNFTHNPVDDLDGLPVGYTNQTTTFSGDWFCTNLTSTSHFSSETMLRFTALDACSPCPGGICWAVSPTVDGKTYSGNVRDLMQKLGDYTTAVRPAICNVASWSDWPVKGGTVFSQAPAYGSTRSADGRHEYIHIFKPPQGKSIDLEAPQVTPVELFTSAALLKDGHPVALTRNGAKLRLTLSENDIWDPLVNIIDLTISHPLPAAE